MNRVNRKILLIPLYVILAVAGTAAVSAYEAHLVNVQAEVANALSVPTTPIILGTGDVYPKEWKTNTFTVSLSDSFLDQDGDGLPDLVAGRVDTVTYRVCAQPKPNTYPYPSVNWDYLWMGGAAFVRIDSGTWHWIGDTRSINPPAAGAVCPTGATGILDTDTNTIGIDASDFIDIGLDVPVFQGQGSPYVANLPRPDDANCNPPAALDEPCVQIPVPPGILAGTDLGLDLVVQVTGITLVP